MKAFNLATKGKCTITLKKFHIYSILIGKVFKSTEHADLTNPIYDILIETYNIT
jgi:hypothetical protein